MVGGQRRQAERKDRHGPYNPEGKNDLKGRSREKPKEDIPPTRTLFVRDVAFESSMEEVESKFKQFGDIKTTFDLISKRGK